MLVYKFTFGKPHKLKFELLNISGDILRFVKKQKCFITSEGVIVTYNGSQVTLEDDEGLTDKLGGIVLPRLPFYDGTSETHTTHWRSKLTAYKSFTSSQDMKEYAKSICRAFFETSEASQKRIIKRDIQNDKNYFVFVFSLNKS